MRIVDRIKEIIALLDDAKCDLQDWMDDIEGNFTLSSEQEDYVANTKILISKIESILHDAGA